MKATLNYYNIGHTFMTLIVMHRIMHDVHIIIQQGIWRILGVCMKLGSSITFISALYVIFTILPHKHALCCNTSHRYLKTVHIHIQCTKFATIGKWLDTGQVLYQYIFSEIHLWHKSDVVLLLPVSGGCC